MTFLSVRSLRTAAGEEADPSPTAVSGRDKQTAVVFLSFFSFLSFSPPEFLSLFPSVPARVAVQQARQGKIVWTCCASSIPP